MHRLLRSTISVLTAGSLALSHVPLAFSQSSTITRADYEACQAQDDRSFALAIEGITQRALKAGLVGVDYHAVVGDEWRRLGLDAILDKQVDIAVEEVRKENSLGSLVRSIANKEKAQELATAVAERVYRSEPIKKAIEKLGPELAARSARIEPAAGDAAEPAMSCLQAFLGPRYGSLVARAVAGAPARSSASTKRAKPRSRPAPPARQQGGHCRGGRAGGAPQLAHGGTGRPADRRQRAVAARLGGGRRRRAGADRQGHLGSAQRRAADHCRGNEIEGHQGEGAPGARQPPLPSKSRRTCARSPPKRRSAS